MDAESDRPVSVRTIQVTLPGDVADLLDDEAREAGATRDDIVSDALRRQLFIRRFNALSDRLRQQIDPEGRLTEEDIFREFS